MAVPTLNQIEEQFVHLPRDEQLALLERLVHQLRLTVAENTGAQQPALQILAVAPQIQSESDRAEFRSAAADLLSEGW